MKTQVFAAKLPVDLKRQIDQVCELLGLKKSFLVEEALREKLEDLLDAHDLRQAIRESSGFHSWESVRKQIE